MHAQVQPTGADGQDQHRKSNRDPDPNRLARGERNQDHVREHPIGNQGYQCVTTGEAPGGGTQNLRSGLRSRPLEGPFEGAVENPPSRKGGDPAPQQHPAATKSQQDTHSQTDHKDSGTTAETAHHAPDTEPHLGGPPAQPLLDIQVYPGQGPFRHNLSCDEDEPEERGQADQEPDREVKSQMPLSVEARSEKAEGLVHSGPVRIVWVWSRPESAMDRLIQGLHHVTATVNDAQQDLDFYAGLLGLRLVKKTVNFDNRHVFHFYYGDDIGTPGTLFTTFPYKGKGVPVGRKGSGQITQTAFSVPSGSLAAWRSRLRSAGVPTTDLAPRFGEDVLQFEDPSGLQIELIASGQDLRGSTPGGTGDPAISIRGLHSVTLCIGEPERSFGFLSDVLGYERIGTEQARTRFAVNGGGPGRQLEIMHAPEAPAARNGLGTVHHVAMGVATPEDQLACRKQLVGLGIPVTEVLDRQYFQSIYFREPGGVLYEIATIPPGFLVDEDRSTLGNALKLPPWEETHRAEIEAGLPAVRLRER